MLHAVLLKAGHSNLNIPLGTAYKTLPEKKGVADSPVPHPDVPGGCGTLHGGPPAGSHSLGKGCPAPRTSQPPHQQTR